MPGPERMPGGGLTSKEWARREQARIAAAPMEAAGTGEVAFAARHVKQDEARTAA